MAEGAGLKFIPISTAASGQTSLVAANASAEIRVVQYVVVTLTAITVQFESSTNDLTGAMTPGINGVISASAPEGRWLFETNINEALFITLGGASQTSGHLAYFLGAATY